MRQLPIEVINHINSGRTLITHVLIWIEARDRNSGEVEGLGLWTGDDVKSFIIKGEARVYHGAGSVLKISPFVSQAQGGAQTWNFQVSSLHEQVIEAIRVYDPRLAPVEVHTSFWDAETHNALADPVREFRGTVMEVELPTPAVGGESEATVTCVPDAWRLTKGHTTRKSQAAIEKRSPSDRFRIYNNISGSVQTAWGEKIKTAEKAASEAAAKSNPIVYDENGR